MLIGKVYLQHFVRFVAIACAANGWHQPLTLVATIVEEKMELVATFVEEKLELAATIVEEKLEMWHHPCL